MAFTVSGLKFARIGEVIEHCIANPEKKGRVTSMLTLRPAAHKLLQDSQKWENSLEKKLKSAQAE